jgi:hypothetical protein
MVVNLLFLSYSCPYHVQVFLPGLYRLCLADVVLAYGLQLFLMLVTLLHRHSQPSRP